MTNPTRSSLERPAQGTRARLLYDTLLADGRMTMPRGRKTKSELEYLRKRYGLGIRCVLRRHHEPSVYELARRP